MLEIVTFSTTLAREGAGFSVDRDGIEKSSKNIFFPRDEGFFVGSEGDLTFKRKGCGDSLKKSLTLAVEEGN